MKAFTSLGRSIMCILVASTAAQAKEVEQVPIAAVAGISSPAPPRTAPSVVTRVDALPEYPAAQHCGQEGVALEKLARTHLSPRCRFEVATRRGAPQLFAVLTVVPRHPAVGTSCTVAQARLARLGEHRVGDELRVRVFVGEGETNECQRQDRLVGPLLGFTRAVETFRDVRKAAFARDDRGRRRALRPNTVRVQQQEQGRSARTTARSSNAGMIARQERQRQLELVNSDVVRHLFATFRHRGLMRYGDGSRRVSPSVTEWFEGEDGRMRLRFLGPASAGRNEDVTPRRRFNEQSA